MNKAVAFNYSSEVYVPKLLYGYNAGAALVGISSLYDITLLNESGEIIGSVRGELLGTTTLNRVPLYISGKMMYFVETDDSGNEYLRRSEYSLGLK